MHACVYHNHTVFWFIMYTICVRTDEDFAFIMCMMLRVLAGHRSKSNRPDSSDPTTSNARIRTVMFSIVYLYTLQTDKANCQYLTWILLSIYIYICIHTYIGIILVDKIDA
jgi:hypothetical protein